MANLVDLKIPDIGGSTHVNVAEVYVKVGDTIKVDDNLVMLETDKATMEVPATSSGIVKKIVLKPGSKVSEGDLILSLEVSGDSIKVADRQTAGSVAISDADISTANTETPSEASSSAIVELKIPDIGGSTDVNVAEVYVKAGDTIKVDDNLVMLETDKATMEVPATAAGVVKKVLLKPGSKVSEGDLILELEVTGSKPVNEVTADAAMVGNAGASKVQAGTAPIAAPSVSSSPKLSSSEKASAIDEESFAKAYASPGIRKLARELGANLGEIKGSGEKGRITEEDLKSFVKSVMIGGVSGVPINGSGLDILPWPKVDFAKFGEVEVNALSRIKKISGANLARNWVMIPHVTQFDEADITELEEFRKQLNEEYKKAEVKVSPLAFIIKACVFALKKFPEFNSSIDGDNLVYKKYYNIGFAADTPHGLVVPVLKEADKKGVVALATETSALAKLAREGKLKPTDMQGGTFTISSLGGIGGTAFTPIVNAPEVAILGVSKSSIKPVWNGSEFAPRLVMPLSLSYDHRIIDGALAAKFTAYLSQVLSDIRRLAL
ncbi:MAG: aceF [Burkholderiales bacterium]|jgi:pyruvate dehydrogenase E2 component (dihydrolipoamide acetyltransferase)|nr:aceF [Burkholderiales bacterium]